jgi:hypothetical protein
MNCHECKRELGKSESRINVAYKIGEKNKPIAKRVICLQCWEKRNPFTSMSLDSPLLKGIE